MVNHSNNFKQNLINLFPKVELSYERFLHKKVSNFDTLMAIPKGPKCYLWITKYNGNNISIFFLLDNHRHIKDIFYYHFDKYFNSNLTYEIGTIFYGTIFYTNINKCFSIENILYHCGKNITNISWGQKWCTIESILAHNLQNICDPKIIVGLPIFSNQVEDFKEQISHSLYGIYKIEYRKFNDRNKSICTKINTLCNNFTPTLSNNVFTIKPTLKNDIYEMYDNNKFIDTAHIPDFKTSVMMNSLFRTIKENINLDALEESDDEEEFQNNDDDQYVSLDLSFKMKCVFNHKFKKWQPIETIN
jgi:hypothetical protein|uniref:mRNA capping enzyme adenylation domain-containing protein n=1 Tax=viral metagenome TaxID=1070528 RepID=A0A6C0IMG5_9ZZZZ